MSGPQFSPAEQTPITSLDTVLTQWSADYPNASYPDALNVLRERLLAREDNMADVLRMAGVQFGLFSEIVAEVLAEVGLGTPITDDQRMFVRRQFAALMERLRAEFGEGGHG